VIGEESKTHDLAFAEGIDQREGRHLGGDVRMPPPLALIDDQDHHLVASVQVVLNVELKLAPGVKPPAPVGLDAPS
jgi:hypothetical protein